MKVIKILLISIVAITFLPAFTFDNFESGIDLDEAVTIARENNIPLSTNGNVFFSKNFDWKYLKNHQNYRIFYYKDLLLGANARVALYFTQDSKKLYKVQINWNGLQNKKEFEEQLYKLMDRKYGERHIEMPSNVGEYVFSRKRVWEIDNNSILKSKASTAGIELVYLDKKYELDDYRTKKKKKLEIIIKDANKF